MQAGGVAPAAGDAQPQYVFIKRAGGAAADGEVYAKLAILPGDDVADLAARACAKFGWGLALAGAPVPRRAERGWRRGALCRR